MKDNEQQLALAGTEEGEILARLSERVERAIGTITELRRERDTLRSRVTELEGQLSGHEQATSRLTDLEDEQQRLQKERGEIRDRIESILSTLETLEESNDE
jgi:FtsZ-binding cell division protein ZapB